MYSKKTSNFIMLRLIFLLFALALTPFATASSIINGLSVHSELGQESFIAALFTSSPSKDAREILTSNTDKQIQVRVLAERLSARRFKRMWIEGMAINTSAADLQNQSRNMAQFSNMLKVTLIRGDIFAIQRTGDAVDVLVNGSKLGTIEDPNFFDLLLRTWIGSVPLSSTFRSDLLVGGELDQALLTRFNGLKPSEERIIAVAGALKDRAEAQAEAAPKQEVAAAITPSITQPVITPRPAAPTVLPAPAPPAITEAATAEETEQSAEPAAAKEEPKPEVASAATQAAPKQSDEPKQTEAAANESILEEDEEDFTAESLLAQQLYIADAKKWVYKKLRYPPRSVENGEEGLVRLEVVIGRDRSVKQVTAIEAPQYSRLTKAAIKAVEKSEPFPEFPAELTEDEFSFTLPIAFKLVTE